MSDDAKLPALQCVECKRQYTENKAEMLLKPWTEKQLVDNNITLAGTYDGCLWP